MFTVYGWKTPNCLKVILLLEELQVSYILEPVNVSKGQHLNTAFRTLTLNGKVPVLTGGALKVPLFESGAILWYLGEYFQAFLPERAEERAEAHAWLMWQMSALGPIFQECFHYRSGSKLPHTYSIQRLTREALRLCGVLNQKIKSEPILGTYSIVDMAVFPWIRLHDRLGINLETFPALKAWYHQAESRPGTQQALSILGNLEDTGAGEGNRTPV